MEHRAKRWMLILGIAGMGAAANARQAQVAEPKPAAAGETAKAGPSAKPKTPNAVPFTPLAMIERMGSGPAPMVLIPDTRYDGSVFRPFMRRNVERYTMYAVTPPGFGGSPMPPPRPAGTLGGWEQNNADAVWKYIETQKLEKPVLLGHGSGARVAYIVAAQHPDAVRAVVAVNGLVAWPVPNQPDISAEDREVFLKTKVVPEMAKYTDDMWRQRKIDSLDRVAIDPERSKELSAIAMRTKREFEDGYGCDNGVRDLRPELGKISAPILMIEATGLDSISGYFKDMQTDLAKAAAKHAPNAKIAVFNQTWHFAFDDRPAEFDAAVRDFLDGKPVADLNPPKVPYKNKYQREVTEKPMTIPMQPPKEADPASKDPAPPEKPAEPQ